MKRNAPAAPAQAAVSGLDVWFGGWRPLAGLLLVWAALFLVRLSAPCDLLDNDQENPAAYVQDVVLNGHWILQRDVFGSITSKPPMYTWLAALSTLALGRLSPLSLALPTALATLGIAGLVLAAGRRVWGARAGWWAAMVYLISNVAAKQMTLVRTDGVFSLWVTAAALAGYAAWIRGGGWRWFWLAAALATLTKGPLGLLFAAGGLLAAGWERRVPDAPKLRGSHLSGVLLYLLLCGGWFYAAWLDSGPAMWDKLIQRELLGHATGGSTGGFPGSQAYKPPLLLLARFAPWSLLAYLGLWRVGKHPARAACEQRFERFLACWLLVGMALLALGAHQRGDLLFPLIPAAALLAGREVDRWLARRSPGAVRIGTGTVPVVGLALLGAYWHVLRPQKPAVRQTVAVQALARELMAATGEECPLTDVDAPYGLQIFLNELHAHVSPAAAAALLADEPAALVATMDTNALAAHLPAGATVHEVAACVLPERGVLRVLSNRPRAAAGAADPVAAGLGPLTVSCAGVRPRHLTVERLQFELTPQAGWVRVHNGGQTARQIEIRFRGGGRAPHRVVRVLNPGETWRIFSPAASVAQTGSLRVSSLRGPRKGKSECFAACHAAIQQAPSLRYAGRRRKGFVRQDEGPQGRARGHVRAPRRLPVGPAFFFTRRPLVPGHWAGWKPAKQQTGNLRYGKESPPHASGYEGCASFRISGFGFPSVLRPPALGFPRWIPPFSP